MRRLRHLRPSRGGEPLDLPRTLSRSSIAARKAPASLSRTEGRSACPARWARLPTSSTRRPSESCRAISRSGHTRYSTAGESKLENAQPFVIDCAHGQIAVGAQREPRQRAGAARRPRVDGIDLSRPAATPKSSCTSTPVRGRRRSKTRWSNRSRSCAARSSLALLTKNRLIAARDPHGFRPLALGRLGDAWIVCSETCALDLIGATYVRDVEPGE